MVKRLKLDFNNLESIKKVEKKKFELECLGYSLAETIKEDNNYILIYKK